MNEYFRNLEKLYLRRSLKSNYVFVSIVRSSMEHTNFFCKLVTMYFL